MVVGFGLRNINGAILELILCLLMIHKGDDYARRMNLYISRFSDGVLFSYSTIKKMATDGGGGVVMASATISSVDIGPGFFFLLIFVYKLTSTNSYML